jgi:hypothetical protein
VFVWGGVDSFVDTLVDPFVDPFIDPFMDPFVAAGVWVWLFAGPGGAALLREAQGRETHREEHVLIIHTSHGELDINDPRRRGHRGKPRHGMLAAPSSLSSS